LSSSLLCGISRLVGGIEPGRRIGLDDDAPALLHQVDVNDPPGDSDRPEVALQHWRVALPGGHAHQRKTCGEGGERQRDFAPRGMTAQCPRRAGSRDRRGNARPQRRLDL